MTSALSAACCTPSCDRGKVGASQGECCPADLPPALAHLLPVFPVNGAAVRPGWGRVRIPFWSKSLKNRLAGPDKAHGRKEHHQLLPSWTPRWPVKPTRTLSRWGGHAGAKGNDAGKLLQGVPESSPSHQRPGHAAGLPHTGYMCLPPTLPTRAGAAHRPAREPPGSQLGFGDHGFTDRARADLSQVQNAIRAGRRGLHREALCHCGDRPNLLGAAVWGSGVKRTPLLFHGRTAHLRGASKAMGRWSGL